MPNPRYMSHEGIPTVELLDKLNWAKEVYMTNLDRFCRKHGFDPLELSDCRKVFLIGSHAKENGWHNETSDLDFKIINPHALPQDMHTYKREVLDPLLHKGAKKRWVDLFFVSEDYQVLPPRWDVTSYWNSLEIHS